MNKLLRTLLFLTFCAAVSAQTINGNAGQSVSGITSSPAYVVGGGTANAQTGAYSPVISSWTSGLQLCWLPVAANTTTTPTFSPNGLAAKTITKNGTAALAPSDITTTAIACGTYDGTELQLQNPQTQQSLQPAFIQSAGNVQVFTASVAQAYSSSVTIGDLLLVSFHCASAVSSMSDSKGNIYTLLARSVDNSVSVWGTLANASGADTVTVNVVNSSNRVALFIEEYANVTPALDGTAVFSTTLANPVTVSTTTSSTNSLIWSYIELGTSSATTPVPTASGFTSRISYNSGTSEIQVAASKTTSTPGTQTASWTNLGTSGVNSVILALRPATGMPNPMMTAGDLIVGGTNGTPTRVIAGTAGNVWVSNGAATVPSWQTPGLSLISTQAPTGTGTVTLSSLGSYKDLIIVVRGASTAAVTNAEVHLQFNADTGTNYDQENITVNNAVLASAQTLAGTFIFAGWVPGTTGVANMGTATEITVYDYAGSTFQKALETTGGLKTSNALANFFTTKNTGWWRSTAAITSVTVFLASGNFATGSSVSLYGRN